MDMATVDMETGEIIPVRVSAGEAQVPAVPASQSRRRLTVEEDTFALAVIECGGNLRKAYLMAFPGAKQPLARGTALYADPAIFGRIQELQAVVNDNALVTLGSHLVELADIRDLAKEQGSLKVALDAEKARGEVAGHYAGKAATASQKGPAVATQVIVNVATAHDAAV